jgi:xanthine/CO dehydrogenase XdhC/CoxF family maturation factor
MAAPLSTQEAVLRAHPSAAQFALYDGRRALGTIVDTRKKVPRAPAAPSYAFDPEGRFIGSFANGRVAAAALSARDDHEAYR